MADEACLKCIATDDDLETCCDVSGRCEAPDSADGISNCIHCGKELWENGGVWYTHDAVDQDGSPMTHAKPQSYSRKR